MIYCVSTVSDSIISWFGVNSITEVSNKRTIRFTVHTLHKIFCSIMLYRILEGQNFSHQQTLKAPVCQTGTAGAGKCI